MAVWSAALVALLAAVASSVGARPRASRDDAVAMVQRDVSPAVLPPGRARTQFKPGDHVLVRRVDGSSRAGAGSTVKGSIIGKGAKEDTYDLHLWVGLPRQRQMLNVPVEVLSDAAKLEAAEAARKRKADREEAARREAERKAEAERQEAEREAELKAEAARQEAERKAGLPRRREMPNVPAGLLTDATELEAAEAARTREADAEEAARREAERKAEVEAEAERREAERKAVEEAKQEAARGAEEEELAKRRAEEEEARRKAAVHAKWETLKAERLKAAGAENATLEVQREVLRSEKFKKQLQDEQVHVRRKMQPAR